MLGNIGFHGIVNGGCQFCVLTTECTAQGQAAIADF